MGTTRGRKGVFGGLCDRRIWSEGRGEVKWPQAIFCQWDLSPAVLGEVRTAWRVESSPRN